MHQSDFALKRFSIEAIFHQSDIESKWFYLKAILNQSDIESKRYWIKVILPKSNVSILIWIWINLQFNLILRFLRPIKTSRSQQKKSQSCPVSLARSSPFFARQQQPADDLLSPFLPCFSIFGTVYALVGRKSLPHGLIIAWWFAIETIHWLNRDWHTPSTSLCRPPKTKLMPGRKV